MEKEKNEKKEKKTKKMSKEKIVFIVISAIILALLGVLIFRFSPEKNDVMEIEEAKTKAESFINESLMMPGTKATITEITPEYGLYKLSVDVGQGEIIESYMSQDGELFIPSSIDIEEYKNMFDQQMMENMVDTENVDTENEAVGTGTEAETIDMENIEIIQE